MVSAKYKLTIVYSLVLVGLVLWFFSLQGGEPSTQESQQLDRALFQGDIYRFQAMGTRYPASPEDSVFLALQDNQIIIAGVEMPDSSAVNGYIFSMMNLSVLRYLPSNDPLLQDVEDTEAFAELWMQHQDLGLAIDLKLLEMTEDGNFLAFLPQKNRYALISRSSLQRLLIRPSDLGQNLPSGP